MSHLPGKYLGGIRTVEHLRERCYVDECTGCWHWRMCIDHGAPNVHFVAPDTGERLTCRGRRAALHLEHGSVPPGRVAIACCDSFDCVNPAHAKFGTWGRVRNPPQPKMLPRERKLSVADVLLIRSSPESIVKMARKLGVGPSAIQKARTGRTYRYVPHVAASVFTLGASC